MMISETPCKHSITAWKLVQRIGKPGSIPKAVVMRCDVCGTTQRYRSTDESSSTTA